MMVIARRGLHQQTLRVSELLEDVGARQIDGLAQLCTGPALDAIPVRTAAWTDRQADRLTDRQTDGVRHTLREN